MSRIAFAQFDDGLTRAGMPAEAPAGTVAVFREILDGRNAQLSDGVRRVLGRPYEPYRYSDHGDVAVIGRLSGVTNIPWMGPFGRQGGFTAWLLWLGIHIFYLIGFSNRIVVLVRWAWTFVTHGRGTRLITGKELLPPIEEPEPPVLAPMEPDEGTPGG